MKDLSLPEKQMSGARPAGKRLELLIVLALLLSAYALVRYGPARGSEGDTIAFTATIRQILDTGKLISAHAYPNGYTYQVLIVYLNKLTAISLGNLQVIGGVMLLAWVVIPAWLAYRELTRSQTVASLAVLILLAQPEFLFPMLRGTHEKFTRGLMFLLLFLLLRSLRVRDTRAAASLIVAFYLLGYALLTSNNLMATSFLVAIGLALLLIWITQHILPHQGEDYAAPIRKLPLVVLSLLALAFLVTFYAYPPAQQQLRILNSVADRLALLFLQTTETASDPYSATVGQGWVSLPLFFLVSIANWLLLVGSMLIWFGQSWRWFIRRQTPEEADLLLWAFYSAFAIQGAISIAVDVSGAIAGNLQHRMFLSFAMVAAPVMAAWLIPARRRLANRARNRLDTVLAVALGGMLVLSLFKATNDPLVSRYWRFVTPSEKRALVWSEGMLKGKALWTGYTDRVIAVSWNSKDGASPSFTPLVGLSASLRAANVLVSDPLRLESVNYSRPLPIGTDSLITYDNGDAKILHSRAKTPYQP